MVIYIILATITRTVNTVKCFLALKRRKTGLLFYCKVITVKYSKYSKIIF